MLTVHQVARLAGVSVRTLHYYDQMGLLPPSSETEAGYRLYDDRALERLQQILFLRELEFPLKEIQPMLELEERGRRDELKRRRQLLLLKQERLQGLIDLCDRMMKGEQCMALDKFDATKIEKAREAYADEAKQRWGKTEAYRESEQKTGRYDKKEWNEVQQESDAILRDMAALVGQDPAGAAARQVVERWQAHITKRYYACNDAILAGLADMYEQDERFAAYLNGFGDGTAAFLTAAIRAKTR